MPTISARKYLILKHQLFRRIDRLDVTVLAEKLGLNNKEGEGWRGLPHNDLNEFIGYTI